MSKLKILLKHKLEKIKLKLKLKSSIKLIQLILMYNLNINTQKLEYTNPNYSKIP